MFSTDFLLYPFLCVSERFCRIYLTHPLHHSSLITFYFVITTGIWKTNVFGLCAAFDSLSCPALWLLLARCGIPQKLISLIRSLYSESTICVRVGNRLSPWFHIDSGVRQGCVIAPDSSVTRMDWLLETAGA